MIRLLPNPDFINWLIAAIDKAKRFIVIVNYLATLSEMDRTGPVARIAGSIARAGKRGAAASVILEGSKFRENYPFYRRLKDSGADVWMDTSLTFIHTKAILVDDKVLCVGSHNLSANALTRHEEASLVTEDAAAIARFKSELDRMTSQRREISSAVCREGTKLPLSIIAPLIKLKRAAAPHAYMLYLLLCRQDGGKPRPIPVDPLAWDIELKLPESTASAKVRIATMLEFMDKKLGVVKYDGKKNAVTRTISFSSPLPARRRFNGGGEGVILIPETFWKHRWHMRLSSDALHLHLAGEAEKLSSPFAPWWRLKRDEIAAKYGFQKQHVNRAQRELQKFGLLEVLFETAGDPQAGRYVRYMNYFRQNPFYDYDARMARIEGISKKYPAKIFSLAQKLLSLVSGDSDAEKLASLCRRIEDAGATAATRATGQITRLAPNSTKRTFEYVEELLGVRP